MFFAHHIQRVGIRELAVALGIPVKNVRRWVDNDSIPAEWFTAVAKATRHLGHRDLSVTALAATAEQRRLYREVA